MVKIAALTILAVIALSGFTAAFVIHPNSTKKLKGSTVTVTTTTAMTTTVQDGDYGFTWLYTNNSTATYVNLFRIDGHTCVSADQGGTPSVFCWQGG